MWMLSSLWTSLGIFVGGLAITILVELGVAVLWRFTRKNELKIVALASLLTYPVLNLILAIYRPANAWFYGAYILILEILVVIVEAWIYIYVFFPKYKKYRLYLMSFTMNLASFCIGLFLNWWLFGSAL